MKSDVLYDYYLAQKRLLAEAGSEFAEKHPEHASLLNVPSLKERDPHVERLLDGVSYMTAQIQKRLDQADSEVSEQVLRQLCPALLMPYPSTTVLQFSPQISMQDSALVKKGALVTHKLKNTGAKNYESDNNTQCFFSTCHPLRVMPFEVEDVDYQENSGLSEIRITLNWVCSGKRSNHHLDELKFYLHGDNPLTSNLFHFFLSKSCSLRVKYPASFEQVDTDLGTENCSASYVHSDGGLLQIATHHHPGYSLLLDYFNDSQRLNFISVRGLERADIPDNCNSFELIFTSNIKLPRGHGLNRRNLIINAVPAVNTFELDLQPIQLKKQKAEYLCSVNESQRNNTFIYSVSKVCGRDNKKGEAHPYIPRYQCTFDREKRLYSLALRHNGHGVPLHYIRVSHEALNSDVTLSLEGLAFNADYPKNLVQENELCFGYRDIPYNVSVKNIVKPNAIHECRDHDKQWQFISLLNAKFATFNDADAMKRILKLFDWSGKKENRTLINSITNIKMESLNQVKHGVFIKGIEILLEINDSDLDEASVFQFLTVLHHFFVMFAPIGDCIQTRALLHQGDTFVWEMEAGQGQPL